MKNRDDYVEYQCVCCGAEILVHIDEPIDYNRLCKGCIKAGVAGKVIGTK